jgi:diketogulonate reductase-like aldo/keto reductase
LFQIKPVTNQVECHPYFPQSKLMAFCAEHGIILTAYSPLGSPDRPWATKDEPALLEDPKIAEIAKRIGKSPAQILLRWQVSETFYTAWDFTPIVGRMRPQILKTWDQSFATVLFKHYVSPL